MQSGSAPGSLHKQVGRKNGKAWSVLNAAWHFVTVTVLHATVKIKEKKIKLREFINLYVCYQKLKGVLYFCLYYFQQNFFVISYYEFNGWWFS